MHGRVTAHGLQGRPDDAGRDSRGSRLYLYSLVLAVLLLSRCFSWYARTSGMNSSCHCHINLQLRATSSARIRAWTLHELGVCVSSYLWMLGFLKYCTHKPQPQSASPNSYPAGTLNGPPQLLCFSCLELGELRLCCLAAFPKSKERLWGHRSFWNLPAFAVQNAFDKPSSEPWGPGFRASRVSRKKCSPFHGAQDLLCSVAWAVLVQVRLAPLFAKSEAKLRLLLACLRLTCFLHPERECTTAKCLCKLDAT